MPIIDGKILSSAMFALASLAACSSSENARQGAPDSQAKVFGDEDRQIARALSISNDPAVTQADSPYARALLCRNGMEALVERFQGAAGLSAEQRQGMERVASYFEGQARVLGEAEGKSPADVVSDLEQAAEDNPDTAENARTAIACLRELQAAG